MIIPRYISFNRWGNQLRIDYPTDIIPVIRDEQDWKKAARIIVASPSFQTMNAPAPTDEKTWEEWGDKFYKAMNDK